MAVKHFLECKKNADINYMCIIYTAFYRIFASIAMGSP